jgi:hypothetical protein
MSDAVAPLSLEDLARRLDDAGITWAVFAGAAAAVYGSARPLTDIDILVRATDGENARSLFPTAQEKRREDGSLEAIHLPDVDLVAGLKWHDAGGTYTLDLDSVMALRITHHEIAGIAMPIVPPEDNILLKALWGRGPEVGKHDWDDVEAMMAHLPTVDWEYLRWRARVCGPRQGTEPALNRLEALWRRKSGDSIGN